MAKKDDWRCNSNDTVKEYGHVVNKNSSKRDKSIDFLSGLLLSYMIYTHISQVTLCDETTLYILLDSFLFFFMPWFYFKSGVFYKKCGESSQKSLKKIWKRFVLPFIVFSIANIPIYCLSFFHNSTNDSQFFPSFIKQIIYDFIIVGSPFGNAPMWFLISLIFIRLLALRIQKDDLYLLMSFSFLVISFFLWKYHIGPIRLVIPSLLGFFFFTLGYFFKYIQYHFLLFLSAIVFYTYFLIFCPFHVSIRSNEIYNEGVVSSNGGGIFMRCFFHSVE